jgi:long-chain acyl-CoA synthetase
VVLSGGDTLSPAKVEGFLTRQPELAQAMVYGDKRPHLVAILVPDEEWLEDWARQHGKAFDRDALAGDAELQRTLEQVVARANKEVAPTEKVRRFTVAPAPFTVDNDMMTPTLKVRRHKVKAAYGERLEALYGGRG